MKRDSKALKGFPYKHIKKDRDGEPNLFKKILLKAKDLFMHAIYYPIDMFYARYTERISRSWAFAKMGWLNYDFDSGTMFNLMAFKLERVLDCLINGHAVQEKENLDALREAIKICKRLYSDNHDEKYYKAHEKKWGRLKMKSIPADLDTKGKPLTYSLAFSRKNALTKKQKEQERIESIQCSEKGWADRMADFDRLNDIFKKYERTWWD